MSRTLALLALAGLALGVSACGGNDKQAAEQTVRDFVKATNERDTEKLCSRLLTQDFIERTTGAQGGQTRNSCKQQLKGVRGLRLRLDGFKKTTVKGDKATVVATIDISGQRQDRPFQLHREDGDWRLAGGN